MTSRAGCGRGPRRVVGATMSRQLWTNGLATWDRPGPDPRSHGRSFASPRGDAEPLSIPGTPASLRQRAARKRRDRAQPTQAGGRVGVAPEVHQHAQLLPDTGVNGKTVNPETEAPGR